MKSRFFIWSFVVAVVSVPVIVFGFVSWYRNNWSSLPVFGEKGHTIDSFGFSNQNGNSVLFNEWKGKIVVANFFFTHCPVVCPKIMHNLKKVQEIFFGDHQVQINSFSVDPERDSTSRLKFYAEQTGITGSWNLITGDKKQIYRLARKSFLVDATDGDGGPADFIHSDQIVLIDQQERVRGYYLGTDATDIDQLIKDIRRLKEDYKTN